MPISTTSLPSQDVSACRSYRPQVAVGHRSMTARSDAVGALRLARVITEILIH